MLFDQYFVDTDPDPNFTTIEPRPEFIKEYVSLWDGWLGEKDSYKLDEVTEKEWAKFNEFITLVSNRFKIGIVNFDKSEVIFPKDISETFSDFESDKPYSEFSNYVIPELNCIITEEWDFTYIVYYKSAETLNLIKPLIRETGLKHFPD